MNLTKNMLAGSLLFVALTGCSSTDSIRKNPAYNQDINAQPTVDQSIKGTRGYTLSNYHVRFMLSEENRRAIEAMAVGKEYVPDGYTVTNSPVSAMIGDLIGGPVMSVALNVATGIGEAAYHIATKDDLPEEEKNLPHNLSEVSATYLPSSINGERLNTAKDAHDYLVKRSTERLKEISQKFHRQLLCIRGCSEDGVRLYQLVKVDGEWPLPKEIIYQPENIFISIDFTFDMIEIDADKRRILSNLIGEDLTWTTRGFNGSFVRFITVLSVDDSGQAIVKKDNTPDKYWHLFGTRWGREFYRMYFQGRDEYYGTRNSLFSAGNLFRVLGYVRGVAIEEPAFDYSVMEIDKSQFSLSAQENI